MKRQLVFQLSSAFHAELEPFLNPDIAAGIIHIKRLVGGPFGGIAQAQEAREARYMVDVAMRQTDSINAEDPVPQFSCASLEPRSQRESLRRSLTTTSNANLY